MSYLAHSTLSMTLRSRSVATMGGTALSASSRCAGEPLTVGGAIAGSVAGALTSCASAGAAMNAAPASIRIRSMFSLLSTR
ncbi:hypothetical protein D3876_08825 [Sphingomonas cavernae]|uniref:Uncharacterized protein n=1 Tax=Sphingomonas cavernae TaxID=2320861 RepID=A0A418WK06_9SPHN|nr:hypothetical protein D3876_08825 [Sphingomonas cavernae]